MMVFCLHVVFEPCLLGAVLNYFFWRGILNHHGSCGMFDVFRLGCGFSDPFVV